MLCEEFVLSENRVIIGALIRPFTDCVLVSKKALNFLLCQIGLG